MFIIRTIPAACAALFFVSLPAVADEATESFLKGWVSDIDASPDFSATYASVATDAASGRTTLLGLSVKSEKPGFSVDVASIGVTGYDPAANAVFAADEVTVDGGTLNAGIIALKVSGGAFSGFSLPPASAFVWDNTQPYLAMVKVLKAFAGISMASGRINSVVLDQNFEGEESTTTYSNVAIDNWDNGKIAAITAAPLKAETPSGETLVAMSIASAETRDLDIGAMITILDPDSYPDGKGDMVWHTILGHTGYSDLLVAIPGVTIRIADASNDDFRMRQPANGIGTLLDLGLPGTEDKYDDPDNAAELFGILSAFGIGKIAVNGIQVEASGVEKMGIGAISLTDLSSDGLGEFAIDGVDAAIDGQGALSVGRVALGGLIFPSAEALMAAAAAEETGADVDVSEVLPKLGFFEAVAVDVALDAVPPASLERVRLDLADYVGPVPTDISFDLANADIDVAMIEEDQAREMLKTLGYERVQINSGLKVKWSESGTIDVGEYRVGIRDFGTLNGSAVITGLLPSEYEMLEDASVLGKLSFVSGALTVTDDSIVGRGIAMQAAQLNADPDEFRQQFAMGLPFMLTFLGDTELQQQIAPILQTFIRTTGGSITATAQPPQPVPMMLLAAASESAPLTLLKLLGVTFTGVAGEEPAPADAAPATPAAPEAAPAAPAEPAPEASPAEPPKMPDADKPSKDGGMRSTIPSESEAEPQ